MGIKGIKEGGQRRVRHNLIEPSLPPLFSPRDIKRVPLLALPSFDWPLLFPSLSSSFPWGLSPWPKKGGEIFLGHD